MGRPKGSKNKPKEAGIESGYDAVSIDRYANVRNAHDPTPKQMLKGDALGRAQFCVDELWRLFKYGPVRYQAIVAELARRRLVEQEVRWGLQLLARRGRIVQNEQGYWERVEVTNGRQAVADGGGVSGEACGTGPEIH